MEIKRNKLNVNEIITEEMLEDKDFCAKIVSCKDRDEVKEFLALHGINADDNDIDVLAKNISEVADICKKLDDEDLDNIAGGFTPVTWGKIGNYGTKFLGGLCLATVGGLFLAFIGAGIKKLGDEKGWWNKSGSKK